jgi:hypothetical protein
MNSIKTLKLFLFIILLHAKTYMHFSYFLATIESVLQITKPKHRKINFSEDTQLPNGSTRILIQTGIFQNLKFQSLVQSQVKDMEYWKFQEQLFHNGIIGYKDPKEV